MNFVVYPALDLRDGQVVRLNQGDFSRETRYDTDPIAAALAYAQAGAQWLHVVDLDAARLGRFMAIDLISRIALDSGLKLQVGGGVRSADDVETLLQAGASRVVVGSTSVRQPEWVASWIDNFGAERICVALDARVDASGAWRVPVGAWSEDTGVELLSLLDRFSRSSALHHVLCTDISRDGMLSGPNIDLYRELCSRYPQLAIQASGGLRNVDDAVSARAVGVGGVIVGKALLEGKVTLRELLAC